jgi:tRNA(Met) C34 N-acetyltransferase TmcA
LLLLNSRFNERFLLSLGKCSSVIFLDDELNLLKVDPKKPELEKLDVDQGTPFYKTNNRPNYPKSIEDEVRS